MTGQDNPPRRDTASRVVEADADTVYRAFGDGVTLMAWLPPRGMTGRAIEYEFREGGRYRIELTYDLPQDSHAGKTTRNSDISAGRFVSLVPGRSVVQTVEFESSDALMKGEMVMRWSFEPAPEGTLVTIAADNVPAGVNQQDYIAGLQASLDNLARYLIRTSS